MSHTSRTSQGHADLVRAIGWILLGASLVLSIVMGAYAIRFASHGLSHDPAEWGQFGDFVGGTTNPILAFLTLVVLALTIVLQSRQLTISTNELELSRRELELTREELARSAQAQEHSGNALREQAATSARSARLAATNFLLSHYRSEIDVMSAEALMSGDPRRIKLKELYRRETVLLGILEELFREISGETNGNVQDR